MMDAGKNILRHEIVFELCAETLAACMAAKPGGADRIELCTTLEVGGLTPSHAFTSQAVEKSGLPVHVLVRPRAGGFNYTTSEFDLICADIGEVKRLGASGVVVGALSSNGCVDIKRTRMMVELAAPLEVTFHRAFDATANLAAALEDVIATGCHRILTSGGAADVFAGAEQLSQLVIQAAGRVEIALGGGLRPENAQAVRRITGARQYHSSVGHSATATEVAAGTIDPDFVQRIRALIQLLQS